MNPTLSHFTGALGDRPQMPGNVSDVQHMVTLDRYVCCVSMLSYALSSPGAWFLLFICNKTVLRVPYHHFSFLQMWITGRPFCSWIAHFKNIISMRSLIKILKALELGYRGLQIFFFSHLYKNNMKYFVMCCEMLFVLLNLNLTSLGVKMLVQEFHRLPEWLFWNSSGFCAPILKYIF